MAQWSSALLTPIFPVQTPGVQQGNHKDSVLVGFQIRYDTYGTQRAVLYRVTRVVDLGLGVMKRRRMHA